MALFTEVYWFALVGILVHVVYLGSIFEVYFTSPIVSGMAPHSVKQPAPAKRLVFIVSDGLRADKLYEIPNKNTSRSPYLRDIVENHGSWGVLHTRVPTESRPGHVALLAGFYEDVSAVTKGTTQQKISPTDTSIPPKSQTFYSTNLPILKELKEALFFLCWKENPVEFDSLFNQSYHTWSWGSPDILPMFSNGANPHRVDTYMYPPEFEDFATDDASRLDTWVFDRVEQFFMKAKLNSSLSKEVKKGGVLLFLHLLGVDTNGHAHKPYSKEYLDNIAVVDKGIEKTVRVIEDFFEHDQRTSYIFTSDHGMTDWGSHGAGLNQETDCPIIAWGAGISKATPETKNEYQDGYSKKWHLSHIRRSDVMQKLPLFATNCSVIAIVKADVAPLAASLLGIPIPVNSVGILPSSFLNTSDSYTAECIIVNAKEIVAQFKIKRRQRRTNTLPIFYRQFRLLQGKTADIWVDNLTRLHNEGRYDVVISSGKTLATLAIEGLNYYHNYDRLFLSIMIASGFVGWILYIVLFLIKKHTNNSDIFKVKPTGATETIPKIDSVFVVISLIAFLFLFAQRSPFTHYIYVMVPNFFWSQILRQRKILSERINDTRIGDSFYIVLLFFCIELLVISFFYRISLTIALVGLGVWPLTTTLMQKNKFICGYWLIACLLVGIFPSLPAVGRAANYTYVTIAGILTVLIGLYIITRFARKVSSIFYVQLVVASLAVIVVNNTARSINNKHGLPLFNQIYSWLVLCTSWILPLFSSNYLLDRLLSIFLSLMSTYILFSTSYEALFCLCFCNLLSVWIIIEQKLSNVTTGQLLEIYFENRKPKTQYSLESFDNIERKPISADLRLAYFFVLFIVVAFFGTGNIASINSFDPMTVCCFLTVFSPFTMGILLVCKILIPFAMVMGALYTLKVSLRIPITFLLLLVLSMTDLMAMNFFFMIRDQGSWLDIGTSISHYVIMMLVIISLVSLFGLSGWLISYSPIQSKSKNY
ncbi:GPI ethanolamine phosphate transferase 1 [Trichoplax sp. H2]|nr:GPI ethanolamine phosphate transferase 1 [Trichoplax sp. H2]|eukprot:RDD47130.1 GPI ethanolamine phosphate transferase 1 [Trichoplax sp. H2]